MKSSAFLLALLLAAPGDLKIGEVVPDAAFKAGDGKEIKLSDFRADAEKKVEGKVVVLYFQSEKCPVAVKPEAVAKLAAPYADAASNVAFISVWAYHHDTEEAVRKYVAAHGHGWTWTHDAGHKLSDHLGAKQVNTTFVLDRAGKLVYRGGCGVKEETFLADAVKAALGGTPAPESDRKFAG